MNDITLLVAMAIFPMLFGGISAYLVLKIGISKAKQEIPNILLDSLDQLTPELPKILANNEIQRFIYGAGVLIGNGAKSGLNLPGSKGGKFKLEDLILQGIGNFILPKIMEGAGVATNSPETSPSTPALPKGQPAW